ncbi:hypothetical protein YC2023_010185 [Brassica napus]
MLNSPPSRNASRPNKSTIKAVGLCCISSILDRRVGMVSRIMVKRLIAIKPDGLTKPEISGVGRPMTSISVASQPGELRN